MGSTVIGILTLLVSACSGSPGNTIGYVPGAPNAEDLAPLPGSKWIVAGGLDEPKLTGRLSLIDREARTARLLFSGDSPVTADKRDGAKDCPGPLQPGKFGALGIALRPAGPGKGALYVINHAGREAVELFSLDWSGADPRIAWTGCIPLPPGVLSNAVAPLADGGIAVTWMNAPEFFDQPAGRANPQVWMPKFIKGEATMPLGTELSVPGTFCQPSPRLQVAA